MRLVIKKGFTLVELIVVITVISILGAGSYFVFSGNIDDATYSTDNTILKQAQQEVDRMFVKDLGIDGSTNTDHKIRFNQNQGSFDIGTIDTSDSSSLTNAEASQVFVDILSKKLNLIASEFDVKVCDRDATDANLDNILNTKIGGRYYELIFFTDSTGNGTDCSGTITAGTTQIAGYSFRYKNAKLDSNSDNYESDKKTDGGARISATALNGAGENTVGKYTVINSALAVTNKGF